MLSRAAGDEARLGEKGAARRHGRGAASARVIGAAGRRRGRLRAAAPRCAEGSRTASNPHHGEKVAGAGAVVGAREGAARGDAINVHTCARNLLPAPPRAVRAAWQASAQRPRGRGVSSVAFSSRRVPARGCLALRLLRTRRRALRPSARGAARSQLVEARRGALLNGTRGVTLRVWGLFLPLRAAWATRGSRRGGALPAVRTEAFPWWCRWLAAVRALRPPQGRVGAARGTQGQVWSRWACCWRGVPC